MHFSAHMQRSAACNKWIDLLVQPVRHACPRGICSACVNFFFYLFENKHLSKIISGSTGPIFSKFSPYGWYLIVDYWSDPLDRSRDVTMATNITIKIGKICLFTFIRHFGIPKWQWDIAIPMFICDDMSMSCKNVVNVGPVTPEFKRLTGVHPSSICSLATFDWRRHC